MSHHTSRDPNKEVKNTDSKVKMDNNVMSYFDEEELEELRQLDYLETLLQNQYSDEEDSDVQKQRSIPNREQNNVQRTNSNNNRLIKVDPL